MNDQSGEISTHELLLSQLIITTAAIIDLTLTTLTCSFLPFKHIIAIDFI